MELSRAEWIRDDGEDDGLAGWAPALSALRQLWSRMFRKAVEGRLSPRRPHRHLERGEPTKGDRRRSAGRQDHNRSQRRSARRPPRPATLAPPTDPGAAPEATSAERTRRFARRFRRPRRTDQGRRHLHQGLRSRLAANATGRADHRAGRRGSRLRRALPRAGRHARPAGQHSLPRTAAAGADLRRPRRGRADQLQRRAAAGDPRGLRRRVYR